MAHIELLKTNCFSFFFGTVNAFLKKKVNGQFYWYGKVRASRIMTKNRQSLLMVRITAYSKIDFNLNDSVQGLAVLKGKRYGTIR